MVIFPIVACILILVLFGTLAVRISAPVPSISVHEDASPELEQIDPVKYPHLFSILGQIDDIEVTTRIRRMLTLLRGLETDTITASPGAKRGVSESDLNAVLILPDMDPFSRAPKQPGSIFGEAVMALSESTPSTELRNRVLDMATAQRAAIAAYASAQLLDITDVVEQTRRAEAYAKLDVRMMLILKRIALETANQKKRLNLNVTYKYNGLYSSDFVTKAMLL